MKRRGINHLDGVNLPSQESVNEISRDCMHLLFPGYFEETACRRRTSRARRPLLARIGNASRSRLRRACASPATRSRRAARDLATQALGTLPELSKAIRTDVEAAYQGDPAALSYEEIILAYPCVLAISLQRFAHVLYRSASRSCRG
jgi:serine O-acetyltransferase